MRVPRRTTRSFRDSAGCLGKLTPQYARRGWRFCQPPTAHVAATKFAVRQPAIVKDVSPIQLNQNRPASVGRAACCASALEQAKVCQETIYRNASSGRYKEKTLDLQIRSHHSRA